MLSLNSLIMQKVLNNHCVCSFELYTMNHGRFEWFELVLQIKFLDTGLCWIWTLSTGMIQAWTFLSCVMFLFFFSLSPHRTLHAFLCAWAWLKCRTEISALWNVCLKICFSHQLLYSWVVDHNSFNLIGPLLTERVAGGVDRHLLGCMLACLCFAVVCSIQMTGLLLGLICIPLSLGHRK
jgi:hypothetical protein